MMGALSVNAAGSHFRGAAFAGDLVAQLGLVICTALWSFKGPFSFDDIFKVETFDKTFQKQI